MVHFFFFFLLLCVHSVKIRDMDAFKEVFSIIEVEPAHNDLHSMAWSQDGQLLAVALNDGNFFGIAKTVVVKSQCMYSFDHKIRIRASCLLLVNNSPTILLACDKNPRLLPSTCEQFSLHVQESSTVTVHVV